MTLKDSSHTKINSHVIAQLPDAANGTLLVAAAGAVLDAPHASARPGTGPG